MYERAGIEFFATHGQDIAFFLIGARLTFDTAASTPFRKYIGFYTVTPYGDVSFTRKIRSERI